VTLETVNTREQAEKQIKKFNMGAQTSPRFLWDTDENGLPKVPEDIYFPLDLAYRQVILAGTVFKPYDLFHEKAGRIQNIPPGVVTPGIDPTYKVLYFDCWKDYEKKIPLWPEQWSAEALMEEERSVKHLEFNCRYRNIAIDEGQTVFKKKWIWGDPEDSETYPGCLDKLRKVERVDFLENPHIVVGFDPSTSRTTKGSSACAFVVLAVDKNETEMKRYLIDCYKMQLGFEDIFSWLYFGDPARSIEGLWNKYHYNELRVETTSFLKWLYESHKTKEAIGRGITVTQHDTQKNKADPVMGVASLQSLFQAGMFRIPYANDPATRERIDEFLQDIEEFPEGTQDYPMAMWFAELGVREMNSRYQAWSGGGHGLYVQNPYYTPKV
jgi:hypothetical protein